MNMIRPNAIRLVDPVRRLLTVGLLSLLSLLQVAPPQAVASFAAPCEEERADGEGEGQPLPDLTRRQRLTPLNHWLPPHDRRLAAPGDGIAARPTSSTRAPHPFSGLPFTGSGVRARC